MLDMEKVKKRLDIIIQNSGPLIPLPPPVNGLVIRQEAEKELKNNPEEYKDLGWETVCDFLNRTPYPIRKLIFSAGMEYETRSS